LTQLLRGLNISVSVYDPFLDKQKVALLNQAGVDLVDLPGAFACAAVSLHVPLTASGVFPTHNMIDASLLSRLSPTSTFINACRGGVVNEQALLDFLNSNPDAFAALDVWNSEPVIDQALLARANIATPHMAGYSRNAKARATEMLLQQYQVDFLKQPLEVSPSSSTGEKVAESLAAGTAISAIQKALPLDLFTADFKQQCQLALPEAQTSVFDSYRKSMINRTEFSDYAINEAKLSIVERESMRRLGFTLTAGLS
jgi:erythronate-4-phosphate dehydrogenase